MADDLWRVFDLATEIAEREKLGLSYREFLRVPSLSCGIYFLPAGATDLQSPHDEDEVYYVIQGRGRIRVADQDRAVSPGSLLYVRASSNHSFFEITEDITLLVFFPSGGPSSY